MYLRARQATPEHTALALLAKGSIYLLDYIKLNTLWTILRSQQNRCVYPKCTHDRTPALFICGPRRRQLSSASLKPRLALNNGPRVEVETLMPQAAVSYRSASLVNLLESKKYSCITTHADLLLLRV